MRACLAITLAAPLVFWACGDAPPRDGSGTPRDGGSSADAAASPIDAGDGPGVADAGRGDPDAGALDAEAPADAGHPDAAGPPDAGPPPCTYPPAMEPMQLGRALYPYSWSDAVDPSGAHRGLALTDAYCDADAAIDWSAFEHLLFVSMPAW